MNHDSSTVETKLWHFTGNPTFERTLWPSSSNRRIQKRNWRRDKNRGQSRAPKISIQARDFLERLKEWYMVSDDFKFANAVRAPRCLVVSVLLPYFSDDPCLNPAAFYYDWIVCLILTGKSFANVMPVIQNWICVLFFTTTPNRRKISTY